MKKQLLLLAGISYFIFSCAPNEIPTPPEPTSQLTDTSIIVPDFTSNVYNVAGGYINLVPYNGIKRIFYFKFNGTYQLATADLDNLSSETILQTETMPNGTLDCRLDEVSNVVKLAYNYKPGYPYRDLIRFATYNNGSFSANDIARGLVDSEVHLQPSTSNEWYVVYGSFDVAANKIIYYNKINFTAPTTYTNTPAYDGNSPGTLYCDYGQSLYNLQSFDVAVNNEKIIAVAANEDNDYVTSFDANVILNSNWSSSNAGYDIAPLGSYFLFAYEDQTDTTSNYNNSSTVYDQKEHVRLTLFAVNEPTPVLNNYGAWGITQENSVMIPVTFENAEEIGKIVCIYNPNADETGIAYQRNGHLYFTIAKYTNNLLNIGVVKDLGAITYNDLSILRGFYCNQHYYITQHGTDNSFIVFESN